MKYIKLFEDEQKNIRDDRLLITYITQGKGSNDAVKDLIKKGVNVNYQNVHGYTPLIWAADKGNIIAMIDLINAGADWNLKSNFGQDFFTYLGNIHKHTIINRFPEKYQEYLMKKDAKNYNL